MANMPYPLTGYYLEEMKFQVYELIRQLYEEKIGGADLGDVFSIPGDVLTLNIADTSGLTKSGNELSIDAYSLGGMQINANGLSIKILATGGLETSASGLGIKLDGTTLSLGASGLKVTGGVPYSLVTHDADTILVDTDLLKIHVFDCSLADKTVTLPSALAGLLGYWVTLVRDDPTNDLIIQASGTDVILNSSAGGNIDTRDGAGVTDTHDFSTMTLMVVKAGQWVTPEFGIWSSY